MSAPAETTVTQRGARRSPRSATCSSRRRTACPSASEADPNGKWLERALAARPTSSRRSRRCSTRAAADKDPEAEARRLHAEDTDGFRALATIVSGAYYMNLKVRKRIGFPGQGKRPPFSDEAEYDLRDGLLDPIIERAPSYQDPAPAFATNGKVEPLPFTLSLQRRPRRRAGHRSRRRADRSPRATWPRPGFRVVCLEQGDWANPDEFPGDKLEFELVSEAQWSPDPERPPPAGRLPTRDLGVADHAGHVQRGRRLDRPLLRPVGADAAAGFKLRSLDGSADDWPVSYEEMKPYYERIDQDMQISGMSGDPGLPVGAGAGVTAIAHRTARTQGGGGHERARLALVARGTRDSLGSRREPGGLRADRHLHVGLPQGSEELDRHDHVAEGARSTARR